jgi:Family of unknown function (DUF6448)
MKSRSLLLFPFLAAALFVPRAASAHCDTLDGPVVTAARTALESGKIAPVLAWVQPDDEEEIRHAFASARAVRKGGKEARELADRWFFETIVRVHRAGEGAPFTGLKPAGMPDPAVAAADRVISGGEPKQLEELLVHAVRDGLHGHVARLKKELPPADDVAAGRRWVAAYVPFVHWAEGVHAAAAGPGKHGSERAAHGAAEHAGHQTDHDAVQKAAAPDSGHHDHR